MDGNVHHFGPDFKIWTTKGPNSMMHMVNIMPLDFL